MTDLPNEEPRRVRPARLPASLDAELRAVAAHHRLSVNAVIVMLLEKALHPDRMAGQLSLVEPTAKAPRRRNR